MKTETAKLVKIEAGSYDYLGRRIYKSTNRSGAYNPWRVMGCKFGFATLADAKEHVETHRQQSSAE